MKKCRGCLKVIWPWQDEYRFRKTCGNKCLPRDVWHAKTCNPNVKGNVFDKK